MRRLYPIKAPMMLDGWGQGLGLYRLPAAVHLYHLQHRHSVRSRRNTSGVLNAAALAPFGGLRRVPEK